MRACKNRAQVIKVSQMGIITHTSWTTEATCLLGLLEWQPMRDCARTCENGNEIGREPRRRRSSISVPVFTPWMNGTCPGLSLERHFKKPRDTTPRHTFLSALKDKLYPNFTNAKMKAGLSFLSLSLFGLSIAVPHPAAEPATSTTNDAAST
jgi:hypothetical protein